MKEWRDKNGYPREWLDIGLWRWRKLPKGMLDILEKEGIILYGKEKAKEPEAIGAFKFFSAEGYQPCEGGVSVEGMFDKRLDMGKVTNLMQILGEGAYDNKTDSYSFENVDVFGEGGVAIRGKNEKEAKKLMSKVRDVILRAHLCVGCGICTGRCDQDALRLEEHVYVDEEKCIHCGECLGPCPVIGYGEGEFEF